MGTLSDRSVYPCHYMAGSDEFVVINFDPDQVSNSIFISRPQIQRMNALFDADADHPDLLRVHPHGHHGPLLLLHVHMLKVHTRRG